MSELRRFDGGALFDALDAERRARELTWTGMARELWAQSEALNAVRDDHPIAPATITGLRRRGTTSCQHALFFLRWLGRTPEDFLDGPPPVPGRPLPAAGPDRRLRWHLHARPSRPRPGLFEAVDDRRRARDLTWAQLAAVLGTTPGQASGLRRARYAIEIGAAMRMTQWLERPAADFVYPARW
jgi:hypothetical protein